MKRTILAVVVVLVILIGVFVLIRYRNGGSGTDVLPESTSINKIENIPGDQLPREFPLEIPIEANSKIITNYNATTPDGRVQATRSFQSSKSLDTNLSLYKNVLAKNSWKILDQIDVTDQKIFFARKDSSPSVLTITISATGNTSIVDLTFLANP